MSSLCSYVSVASFELPQKQCLSRCMPALPPCSASSSFYATRNRRTFGLLRATPRQHRQEARSSLSKEEEEEAQYMEASGALDLNKNSSSSDWMSWTPEDEPVVSDLTPMKPYGRQRQQIGYSNKQFKYIDSQEKQGFLTSGNSPEGSEGSMFTSKLGEILANFKKKESPSSFIRGNRADAVQDQHLFPKGRSLNARVNRGEKIDPVDFNLFANPPAVPWETDRRASPNPRIPVKKRTSHGASSPGSPSRSWGNEKRNVASSPGSPSRSWGNEKRNTPSSPGSPSRSWGNEKRNKDKFKPRPENGGKSITGSDQSTTQVKSGAKKEEGIGELGVIDTINNQKLPEVEKSIDTIADIDFEWGNSDTEDLVEAESANSSWSEDDMDAPIDSETDSVNYNNDLNFIGPTNAASWKHNLPQLPFEFQYSYSEAPKVPVVRFRERPYSPFGPTTMQRPWTGCAPLKPSKKKLPEFDSFKPPPKGKKGIKFVQDPGPFPEGQRPKPSKTKEEIHGEPLTNAEIVQLVERCKRDTRQVNLGRDGLTHNMLEIIHCHWKRRRVCKIKCKGVPTVDMDNVCFHLEDKTGGKIIYRTGGVVYLFRGRNYNYKDRPKIPLMLWKPATPVYPKLIQEAPEGLTKEEADRLRVLGRKVEPTLKLGKNGVYLTLVEDVRNAFKVDDLVRIDCRGLNPSDYKKIGAKLKDLVPCVLLSFDKEHILMWRGKGEVSPGAGTNTPGVSATTDLNIQTQNISSSDCEERFGFNIINHAVHSDSFGTEAGDQSLGSGNIGRYSDLTISEHLEDHQTEMPFSNRVDNGSSPDDLARSVSLIGGDHVNVAYGGSCEGHSFIASHSADCDGEHELNEAVSHKESDGIPLQKMRNNSPVFDDSEDSFGSQFDDSEDEAKNETVNLDPLWDHALESGMAVEINESDLNCESVLKKVRELAEVAPLGPEYTRSLLRRLQVKKEQKKQSDDLEVLFTMTRNLKKPQRVRKRVFQLPTVEVPAMGGLAIDELARLLAPR